MMSATPMSTPLHNTQSNPTPSSRKRLSCLSCSVRIPDWEQHQLCYKHRKSCNQDNTCSICKNWQVSDWTNLSNYLEKKRREDTVKTISLNIVQGVSTSDPQGHGYKPSAIKRHKKRHKADKVQEEEQGTGTSIETISYSDSGEVSKFQQVSVSQGPPSIPSRERKDIVSPSNLVSHLQSSNPTYFRDVTNVLVDQPEEMIYADSDLYGEYMDVSSQEEEGVSTPGKQMPPAVLTPPGMTSENWAKFIEGQRLIFNQLSSYQVGQTNSISTHQAGFQESGLYSSKETLENQPVIDHNHTKSTGKRSASHTLQSGHHEFCDDGQPGISQCIALTDDPSSQDPLLKLQYATSKQTAGNTPQPMLKVPYLDKIAQAKVPTKQLTAQASVFSGDYQTPAMSQNFMINEQQDSSRKLQSLTQPTRTTVNMQIPQLGISNDHLVQSIQKRKRRLPMDQSVRCKAQKDQHGNIFYMPIQSDIEELDSDSDTELAQPNPVSTKDSLKFKERLDFVWTHMQDLLPDKDSVHQESHQRNTYSLLTNRTESKTNLTSCL